ncbi:MAG: flagellar hook-length control protein FliK [Desulfocapsaceae bacterium]|nr:flagellar hook-length control protein FliK [Desulfocapsaceae bacterium]
MEASLLAVTPVPTPPQDAPSQTTTSTDEATSFSTFLSAAKTTHKEKDIPKGTEDLESESMAASPSQQEMLLPAELSALASLNIPVLNTNQFGPEQDITATFTSISDGLPEQDITTFSTSISDMLPEQNITTFSTSISDMLPEQNGTTTFASISNIAPEQNITTTFANISETESSIILTPDDLKQFQSMLTAKGQSATDFSPVPSKEQLAGSANKTESILGMQLQGIITDNSRNTIAIHTPYQSAADEGLNALSSPYLQSANSITASVAISTAHVAMPEKGVDVAVTTKSLESVHQNVEEQYLNAKIIALADKNNAKNQQQETGQQENSTNQQATPTLTSSLNNNEQTGQFIITTPGVQTSALTPGNSPTSSHATYSPGIPVAAEEIISHLIDRFSTNPRLQTSKISLNLNPAELGSLKIDILVKGDSIKAHITANSQQIQDTIEKNMPKLRTILEQQGFSIEEFQVNLASDNSDSNNFFQQHFSSRQDSTPQKTLPNNDNSFDISLNSAEEILSNTSMDSGINLNI